MSFKKVAKFHKVSLEQFIKDYKETFPYGQRCGLEDTDIVAVYNHILLPTRATVNSAGYDIRSTIDVTLKCGESIKIPTGIRCEMQDNVALMIYPRSSMGFKYSMMLNNTVGIIDSDYFYAENEGHIFVKITNGNVKELHINVGDAFSQGVFTEYLLTVDDDVKDIRKGGIGSTSEK